MKWCGTSGTSRCGHLCSACCPVVVSSLTGAARVAAAAAFCLLGRVFTMFFAQFYSVLTHVAPRLLQEKPYKTPSKFTPLADTKLSFLIHLVQRLAQLVNDNKKSESSVHRRCLRPRLLLRCVPGFPSPCVVVWLQWLRSLCPACRLARFDVGLVRSATAWVLRFC
jgi:hypothetical protein